MKNINEILQIFGGSLIIVFVGCIVIDLIFSFTWPFKEGTITYIVWENKLYLSLFLLYISISLSYLSSDNEDEGHITIAWITVVIFAISIIVVAIIDLVFTFTWPFKADTYTYRWWNLIWEYKKYALIVLFVITIIDLIVFNISQNRYKQPIIDREPEPSLATNTYVQAMQTKMSQMSMEEQDFLNYLKENPKASIDESVVSLYGISIERALELQRKLKK